MSSTRCGLRQYDEKEKSIQLSSSWLRRGGMATRADSLAIGFRLSLSLEDNYQKKNTAFYGEDQRGPS